VGVTLRPFVRLQRLDRGVRELAVDRELQRRRDRSDPPRQGAELVADRESMQPFIDVEERVPAQITVTILTASCNGDIPRRSADTPATSADIADGCRDTRKRSRDTGSRSPSTEAPDRATRPECRDPQTRSRDARNACRERSKADRGSRSGSRDPAGESGEPRWESRDIVEGGAISVGAPAAFC